MTDKKVKSVVIMGKGALAVKVAEYFLNHPEYKIWCVVPNTPESAAFPSLRPWATKNNISIVESGKLEDVPTPAGDNQLIDLAASATYDKIVKAWFIEKCKKIINIHNGPLPKYRGVNPINWALKNGETSHGVTIHEITPGIDDGPIIAMSNFPIDPEYDEVIDVYERSLQSGWLLFKQTMPKLWEIKPVIQDESLAQYYSKQDFEKLGDRRYFTRQES